MDSLYTLLKIIALLAAVWVGAQWYLSYRRLAHIPGPWLAGLSSFWLVGSVWRRRSHIEFYNITEKYGECCLPKSAFEIMYSLCHYLIRYFIRHPEELNFTSLGSVARIGPNVVLTSNMDLLRRMGAARSPYTRSDWYLAFKLGPKEDNVFSMLDEKKHNKRRAQMTNGVCIASQVPDLLPRLSRRLMNWFSCL